MESNDTYNILRENFQKDGTFKEIELESESDNSQSSNMSNKYLIIKWCKIYFIPIIIILLFFLFITGLILFVFIL